MGSTSAAPDDRFCDLVMKGGIASGIVYPFAIGELAKHYRFRSIGGTSAGAVAASVTAAAEYRRRHQGTMDGFAVVQQVATDLQQPVSDGKLRLEGLFAPDPGCERLFQVLLRTLSQARRTGFAEEVEKQSSRAKAQAATATAGAIAWDMDSRHSYAPGGRGSGAGTDGGAAHGTSARPPGARDPTADEVDMGPSRGGARPAASPYVESMQRALACALLGAYRAVAALALVAGVVAGAIAGWGLAARFVGWQATAAGVAAGVVVGVAVAGLLLLVGIGVSVYLDIVRSAVPNGFGLCRGVGTTAEGSQRITAWLHGLVQSAAGLAPGDPPLTFGQLWDAPGFPPASMQPMDGANRSIDLVMFTTNLAHGRPYVFPHEDAQARLFYDSQELARFLPDDVMAWVDAHASEYEPQESDPPVEQLRARGLKQLPAMADLPVVLAARMSLSYPFLFSAIPLWAIDYEQRPRDFGRCWFSDGGIASNFPMHLFDGFLPSWPTFGIDLEGHLPGHSYVYLPKGQNQGFADRWNRFDEEKAPSTRFAGFFTAVLSTMQNWNDNTNARMPGVRDRIARVRLDEHEGGFNLDMPAPAQQAVAARGTEAARALIAQFTGPPASLTGWDVQRWSRLEVLVRTLQKRMPGVGVALRPSLPFTRSYQSLVANAHQAVPGSPNTLPADKQEALLQLLQLIEHAARDLGPAAATLNVRPIPDPELRVRPPL